MPQGRARTFSGKKKKIQLQSKNARKASAFSAGQDGSEPVSLLPPEMEKNKALLLPPGMAASGDAAALLMDQVNLTSGAGGKSHTKGVQFDLRFRTESKHELEDLKAEARRTFPSPLNPTALEMGLTDFFPDNLNFPQRPDWSGKDTKRILEGREERALNTFINDVLRDYPEGLGHFELNLETWRQLWRVVELSEILLIIVDARYPPAMLPKAIIRHAQSKGRSVVAVLNKADLVSRALAVAWKREMEEEYPLVKIAYFTSCPTYNLVLKQGGSGGDGLTHRRMKGRIKMVREGALQVHAACEELVQGKVDLTSWMELIQRGQDDDDETVKPAASGKDEETKSEDSNNSPSQHKHFKDGILTVGMLGQPNAGKSSLINSLMGKRVVSVSKTPGHTKHFQTIFVTKTVRLCDCPGLVFPSLAPKPLQVLMGSYPISQVREPFSVIQYLGERVDLPAVLRLDHPAERERDRLKWNAFDVCEAWALKRGYVTARSNRTDLMRAANHILRMTLEGKITINLCPRGFSRLSEEKLASLESDPDVEKLVKLLGLNKVDSEEEDEEDSDGFDSDDSEKEDEDEEEDSNKGIQVSTNKFGALMEESGEDSESEEESD